MQSSIREIRSRLFFTLTKAFLFVLSLSVLFFVGVVSYMVTAPSSPLSKSFPELLKGYYLGNGSWEGVEGILLGDEELNRFPIILLDEDNRVVLDRRSDPDLEPGSRFQPDAKAQTFDLRIDNKQIGTIVFSSTSWTERILMARGVLIPFLILSMVLAFFLVVVTILLIRRFVNPLADVIFAAREMRQGKLGTRIPNTRQRDLHTLSESFNEMADALERSNHERRDMLADIAHELRTPLSIIRGRLEGIVDGIYSGSDVQISTVLEQAYVLERLAEDLRLLTLAETRQLVFNNTEVNISELLQRVLYFFASKAQEKNISLSFNKKDRDFSANLDPQRFEQIISNLIANALRYVPEGGKVWVGVDEIPEGLQITVNDNGMGIPEEDLPFIFDRFWRKDKSRSRSSGGTGLGLAIAKQLIEAQGGSIEARNLTEGGLQVVVILLTWVVNKEGAKAQKKSVPE